MAINHRHWEQPPLDPMFNDRSADIRERSRPIEHGALRAGSDPQHAKRFAELVAQSEVPYPTLLGFMAQPASVSIRPEQTIGTYQQTVELGAYDPRSVHIDLNPVEGESEGRRVETALHELGHHLHTRNSVYGGRRKSTEMDLDPSNEAYIRSLPPSGRLPQNVRPHMEGVADGFSAKYTGRYAREELGVRADGEVDTGKGSIYEGMWRGKNDETYKAARAATERRGPVLSDSYWSRSAGGVAPVPKSQITYDEGLPNALPFSPPEEDVKQPAIPGIQWGKFNVTDEQLDARRQAMKAGDIDAANQAVALKKTKRRTSEEVAADKERKAREKKEAGRKALETSLNNMFNF